MRRLLTLTTIVPAMLFGCSLVSDAQEPSSEGMPALLPVEIRDEPVSIDPATLVASRLATATTVSYSGSTLKELYRWLQTEQKVSLAVDAAELRKSGILPSDRFTESLSNEPLYLLLDRLSSMGIGWYLTDEDLHLTTQKLADQQYVTVSYNLGEFLDSGFTGDDLHSTILSTTGGLWIAQGDDEGDLVLLGDVIFVRQTEKVQREVRALLQALKSPARRTLTLDPPQHAVLRRKLGEKFSITLDEVPLVDAISELSRSAQADIRLSAIHLRTAGVSERSPVSLELTDQKLQTILTAMLSEFDLSWVIRDGVIRVMDKASAVAALRAAVYDVRDLCRDASESEALQAALVTQCGGDWVENGDEQGVISFARPGIMVVRQTEQMHDIILTLLENYRTALRGSKARKPAGPDPREVLTYYYRMPTRMAEQLESHLPTMLRPDTWKGPMRPDEIGTISLIASTDELLGASSGKGVPVASGAAVVVQNSVLIITQRREVHLEIDRLLQDLMTGKRPADSVGGLGGGGLGGGSFGGGFFSVDPEPRE